MYKRQVPIFNRFSTRNRVRTARLQQIDLSLRLDNAKKVLYKEIQQAWYNEMCIRDSRIIEGNKERVQLYRGVVIKIAGHGDKKRFTVRKMSGTIGVERRCV